MSESDGWKTPRDMLRGLSPARLARFVSRDWQANALWELVLETGYPLPPGEIDRRRAEEASRLREAHLYRSTLEAGGKLNAEEVRRYRDAAGAEWRAERAWACRGEALDVLRSLHTLRREHGPLSRFLHDVASADRVVAGRMRAVAKTSPPAETAARLVTAENLDTLFRSPLFWSHLAFAWKTAADDRPDLRPDVLTARRLLEAVVWLLAAPLREKGLHPAVRAHRARAADGLLRTRLREGVQLAAQMNRASLGLTRRSEILDALQRWQEERNRREREADAAAGTPSVGGTATIGLHIPCETCRNERHGMAATALAYYRRRHALKGRPGQIPLREVAAAVLLHRCPDKLEARTVTKALERLKKRASPGNRP